MSQVKIRMLLLSSIAATLHPCPTRSTSTETAVSFFNIYDYGFYLHFKHYHTFIHPPENHILQNLLCLEIKYGSFLCSYFNEEQLHTFENACKINTPGVSDTSFFSLFLDAEVQFVHDKAFIASLRMSNRRRECIQSLPYILENECFKERSLLVSTAITLGMDWLAEAILDTVHPEDENACLYLLFKKYLLNDSDTLYRRIRNTISAQAYPLVHTGFKRFILDARDSGRMHEIETVQK
jgi:hypothetical protein